MVKSVKANITPKLLTWARELCNLQIDAAAKKATVSETCLESWENGADQPTVVQARKLAKTYRVPLIAFWLIEPPADVKIPRVRDFRRLPGSESGRYSYELAIAIREAVNKREVAFDLSQNLQKTIQEFRFHYPSGSGRDRLAKEVRSILGLAWNEQREWKDPRITFNTVKERIESKDVLVLQYSRIKVEEFRGFSLFFKSLPVIGLNRSDSYSARTFSLVHEFVHLLFGNTSISNASESDVDFSVDDKIERVCNETAGAVLVPSELLKSTSGQLGKPTFANIAAYAKLFGISRETVAIRAYQTDLITQPALDSLLEQIRGTYRTKKESGFVPPHTDFVSKSGKPIARLLLENLSKGHITENDFSDYSGLKLKHISKVAQVISASVE